MFAKQPLNGKFYGYFPRIFRGKEGQESGALMRDP
jgi:hypothetical protein